MDRFQAMTVFVAVAEAESFAAAGRRLRMSPPAVTRTVAMLEARLGVRLLTRSTRRVRVTDAGARYLEDARRIVLEADEADEAAAGVNATPRGHVAVTASVLFGKLYVMPIITAYLRSFSETTVSALFVDRVVNMSDEGLDVGIRIGPLPDSSLRAIRVGQVRRVICASTGYLKQHGVPQTPAELVRRTIIASTTLSPSTEWQFAKGREKIALKIHPRLLVNTNDGAIEAAKEGFGLTRLLSYQIADALAKGTLRAVLSEYEEAPWPIHVVHREGRYGSAKVRSFVDLAVAMLRADKALS